jgi:hypothetical protein
MAQATGLLDCGRLVFAFWQIPFVFEYLRQLPTNFLAMSVSYSAFAWTSAYYRRTRASCS